MTEEEIDKLCEPFLKMFAEIAYRESQKGIRFPE